MKNYEAIEENIFLSGHAACPGCAQALSLRFILNTLGSNSVVVIPPSCLGVIMGAQPYSSISVPVYKTTFESSAICASSIKRALKVRGKKDVNVAAIAGDGGTYDIGFQALSSVAEHNEDIFYFCLDNEGYMNTGTQKSSSTPQFAFTTSTPSGKETKKKNLTEIMASHEVPYVATANIGYLEDFIYKINKAKKIKGTKIIIILTPCIDGWGLKDDSVLEISRLAVQSGVFPLYEIENGKNYKLNHVYKEVPIKEYVSKQRRFRDLSEEQIQEIQRQVDSDYERLINKI